MPIGSRRSHSFYRFLIPALYILASLLISPPASSAREVQFTILFTNDHHGQLDPLQVNDSTKPVGGVTRRMALIEKIRQEAGPKKVILVDSGDLFTGTALSSLTKGEADCAAYQLMQYDAVALGIHDFDYGKKALVEFNKKFRIPWVSANIVVRGNSQNFMKAYVLRYAGVRIGIIGYSNPETPSLTRRENVSGLIFNPAGAAAKGLHSILKKDADVFIALSQLGLDEDKKFAKDNTFLHVIVGGYSHTLLTEPVVEKNKDGAIAGPIIVQAGSQGLYLGRLDLTLDSQRDPKTKKEEYWVSDYKYQLIPITSDLPEDPKMTALLERYRGHLKAKPLDETLANLTGPIPMNDQGDSLMGQIAVDAMRSEGAAQIALLNSHSIREDLPAGPLTREKLYELCPVEEEVVMLDSPGWVIRKAIEASLAQKGKGDFLQISGLKVQAVDGTTVVLVGDEKLKDRQRYKVAVNDFLAEGGDGYELFRKIKSKRNTGLIVRDLLEKSLQEKKTIEPQNLEKRWDLP